MAKSFLAGRMSAHAWRDKSKSVVDLKKSSRTKKAKFYGFAPKSKSIKLV